MPTPQKNTRVPLIVDADSTFLNQILSDPKASELPPLTTVSGKEAQLHLANSSILLSSIYVERNLPDGYSYSIVRFAHRYRPAVPIYFTSDKDSQPLDQKKLHLLGIQMEIRKPATYSNLLSLQKLIALTFDAATALDIAQRIQSDNNENLAKDESAFVPIFAQNFVSGTTSFFDIFVRLTSGRFVKILKSGDSFTPERIETYLKKGITHFHIRKEVQEIYLSYCEKLTTQLMKSSKVAPVTQVTHILNHGQEMMSFLGKTGVNTQTVKYASNFISNVHELTHKMKKNDSNPYLGAFISNLSAYEHGMAVSVVGAILGNALGIDSGDPVHVLGLACLMHDIGLLDQPEETKSEDISKMSDEMVESFLAHPSVGANMLKTMREINPTTIQAVLQHHERKDKMGFPNKIGVGSINRISEIVGISDEFVRLVKASSSDTKINPYTEMEKLLFKSFTYPVSDAFKKVFIEKLSGDLDI